MFKYSILLLFIFAFIAGGCAGRQKNKHRLYAVKVIDHKEAFDKLGALTSANDTSYIYYTQQFMVYKFPAIYTRQSFDEDGKSSSVVQSRVFYYFIHDRKESHGYKIDSLKISGSRNKPVLDSLNKDITIESVDSFRVSKGFNGKMVIGLSPYFRNVSKTESGDTLITKYASSITEKNDVDTIMLHFRKPDGELPITFSSQLDSLFPPRKLVKYEFHLRGIKKGTFGNLVDLPARRIISEVQPHDDPTNSEILAIIERFKQLKAEKDIKR